MTSLPVTCLFVYYFVFVVVFVQSCDNGLTQLRHPETLQLIRCVPTLEPLKDPCIALTNGKDAHCQLDDNQQDGDYVCCGSVQLLFEMVGNEAAKGIETKLGWRFFPTKSLFDYNVFMKKRNNDFINLDSEKLSLIETTSTTTSTTSSPPSIKRRSTPILQLLAVPSHTKNNETVKVSTNSILVRDGSCLFVVDTGLPHQKKQIVKNLASYGVPLKKIRFVVVTTPNAQFSGNLNLFPSSQVIMAGMSVLRSNVAVMDRFEEHSVFELCSANTLIQSTPGPSTDSMSVIVRNVATMGTVAIVGGLFPTGSRMDKLDWKRIENVRRFNISRSMIICEMTPRKETPIATRQAVINMRENGMRGTEIAMVDWIIPASSPPFKVTDKQRASAGC